MKCVLACRIRSGRGWSSRGRVRRLRRPCFPRSLQSQFLGVLSVVVVSVQTPCWECFTRFPLINRVPCTGDGAQVVCILVTTTGSKCTLKPSDHTAEYIFNIYIYKYIYIYCSCGSRCFPHRITAIFPAATRAAEITDRTSPQTDQKLFSPCCAASKPRRGTKER